MKAGEGTISVIGGRGYYEVIQGFQRGSGWATNIMPGVRCPPMDLRFLAIDVGPARAWRGRKLEEGRAKKIGFFA